MFIASRIIIVQVCTARTIHLIGSINQYSDKLTFLILSPCALFFNLYRVLTLDSVNHVPVTTGSFKLQVSTSRMNLIYT